MIGYATSKYCKRVAQLQKEVIRKVRLSDVSVSNLGVFSLHKITANNNLSTTAARHSAMTQTSDLF